MRYTNESMKCTNTSILIVASDEKLRHKLETLLQDDHHIHSASSTEAGLEALYETAFQLVLLGLRFPGDENLEVLSRIKAKYPDVEVIAISADEEAARKALDRGAFYCLRNEFHDVQLRLLIHRAREREVAGKKMLHLREEMDSYLEEGLAVLSAPKLSQACSIVERLAKLPSAMLITGEPGTPKEAVARFVHKDLTTEKAPFVTQGINKAELAHGGTLFLEEAADLSPRYQSRLLKIIQRGKVAQRESHHFSAVTRPT
jgi:DNA-binding NtrC family response regulator